MRRMGLSRIAALDQRQQRAGLRIDESSHKTGERLGIGGIVRRRVAGRQYDPVRIQLERGNLGCREIAVILLGCGVRRSQDQAGFGPVLQFARHRAMRGEVDDAVFRQFAAPAERLDFTFRRARAEP